ncbi:MAG: hypothetical protein ABIX01_04895 [Chitinophagaceae bacterium]
MTHHKNKHKQKHPTHQEAGVHKKHQQTATTKMAIIFGVAGLAAGALASQLNPAWTLGCAVLGALGGFLIGHGIDKAAAKK